MLWRKLRNVLMVVRQLRYRLRYTRPQSGSETDGKGEEQPYQQEEDSFPLNQLVETGKRGPEDDAQYAGGFIFLVAPTLILSCSGQETAVAVAVAVDVAVTVAVARRYFLVFESSCLLPSAHLPGAHLSTTIDGGSFPPLILLNV